MMSLAALGYLSSIYLQSVTGRDPLAAAVLGIPMAVTVFGSSIGAARVIEAIGARSGFIVALALAAVGNLGLLGTGVDGGLWAYLVGSAVAGVGYGIVFSLVSDVAVSSVPAERAGAATGISETSFELGNAIGLAVLGALASFVFQRDWSPADARFTGTLDDALNAAAGNSGLQHAAQQAFVNGMHVAIGVAGLLLAAMALCAAFVLPRGRR